MKQSSLGINIVISACTKRYDQPESANNKVKSQNIILEELCMSKNFSSINNDNIYDSCLNQIKSSNHQSKNYLNMKGNSYLANNFTFILKNSLSNLIFTKISKISKS